MDKVARQVHEMLNPPVDQFLLSRSLRSFLKTYRPGAATAVNLSPDTQILVEGIPVRFVPFPGCTEQEISAP